MEVSRVLKMAEQVWPPIPQAHLFPCSLRLPIPPGLHYRLHGDPPGGEWEPGPHGCCSTSAARGLPGEWDATVCLSIPRAHVDKNCSAHQASYSVSKCQKGGENAVRIGQWGYLCPPCRPGALAVYT